MKQKKNIEILHSIQGFDVSQRKILKYFWFHIRKDRRIEKYQKKTSLSFAFLFSSSRARVIFLKKKTIDGLHKRHRLDSHTSSRRKNEHFETGGFLFDIFIAHSTNSCGRFDASSAILVDISLSRTTA